jgi:hypothetical protein
VWKRPNIFKNCYKICTNDKTGKSSASVLNLFSSEPKMNPPPLKPFPSSNLVKHIFKVFKKTGRDKTIEEEDRELIANSEDPVSALRGLQANNLANATLQSYTNNYAPSLRIDLWSSVGVRTKEVKDPEYVVKEVLRKRIINKETGRVEYEKTEIPFSGVVTNEKHAIAQYYDPGEHILFVYNSNDSDSDGLSDTDGFGNYGMKEDKALTILRPNINRKVLNCETGECKALAIGQFLLHKDTPGASAGIGMLASREEILTKFYSEFEKIAGISLRQQQEAEKRIRDEYLFEQKEDVEYVGRRRPSKSGKPSASRTIDDSDSSDDDRPSKAIKVADNERDP